MHLTVNKNHLVRKFESFTCILCKRTVMDSEYYKRLIRIMDQAYQLLKNNSSFKLYE